MGVQARIDNVTNKLIRTENSLVRNGVIAGDHARTVALLQYTVMAFNTNGEWVPFIDPTAVTGEGAPRGIYLGGDIPAADLVEGDIQDAPILVGNAVVDRDLVVWDQDILTEDSIIFAGTAAQTTALYALQMAANIYFEDSVLISQFEN
jgi:hypothetical protein